MIEVVKRTLHRFSPTLLDRLQQTYRNHNGKRVHQAVVGKGELRVQSGPFAGMLYASEAAGSAFYPKLLGAYEAELRDVLENLLKRDYQTVINIGCGEGYYAVGIARRLPDAHVFAFDSDVEAQELCKEMAAINGVAASLTIAGTCSHKQLSSLIDRQTLIICDCEGCELEVLQPVAVPLLSDCDLIIELHDFVDRSITPSIKSRFGVTHKLSFIHSTRRNAGDYPVLGKLRRAEQNLALEEFRPEQMTWAIASAKAKHHERN